MRNFNIESTGPYVGVEAASGHRHDKILEKSLTDFLKSKNATSIVDLGAGMGLYTKYFRNNGLNADCFDGNEATPQLSQGRCSVLNLAHPVNIPKYDWLLCLEVGEHIPSIYEENLFKTINDVSRYGAIISWAIPGQDGDGHVNLHTNEYVKNKMQSLGFKNDILAENHLRDKSSLPWFKNTIMVFEKNEMLGENKLGEVDDL